MKHLSRAITLVVATSMLPACMLSRLVDRSFVGITVRKPEFPDRKTTGIFLLPITFAVDVATFPIQALLVVILGDNFPFRDPAAMHGAIASNQAFDRLDDAAKATALAELETLVREGRLVPGAALALDAEGHWTVVVLSDEARAQLLARAGSPPAAAQLCLR
jgi:hypothetical protein